MTFIEGYLTGLALIIFIGPVFFTLIQSTLEYGVKSGLSVALGIFFSDVICVLLLYGFGASDFFTNPDNKLLLGIIGAIILIGLGLKYALRPVLNTEVDLSLKTADYLKFFTKGFLVNFVNPFVFVVWMGIIGFASNSHPGHMGLSIYLAGTLLGILTTDSFKAIFAHKIKGLLQPVWLERTYRVIGIALILFGVRMLFLVI